MRRRWPSFGILRQNETDQHMCPRNGRNVGDYLGFNLMNHKARKRPVSLHQSIPILITISAILFATSSCARKPDIINCRIGATLLKIETKYIGVSDCDIRENGYLIVQYNPRFYFNIGLLVTQRGNNFWPTSFGKYNRYFISGIELRCSLDSDIIKYKCGAYVKNTKLPFVVFWEHGIPPSKTIVNNSVQDIKYFIEKRLIYENTTGPFLE